jgi:hypothetical protein
MKIWAVGVTLFQADTETDMMTPWSFFSTALQMPLKIAALVSWN